MDHREKSRKDKHLTRERDGELDATRSVREGGWKPRLSLSGYEKARSWVQKTVQPGQRRGLRPAFTTSL